MVRRLLLTALLAVLAVALPASAEEDPASSEPSSDPPAECLPFDPFCLPVQEPVEVVWEEIPLVPLEEASDSQCPLFDLNSASASGAIDPDGCYRAFIKRTIGVTGEAISFSTEQAQDTIGSLWPF
jgi:hypothetical protein